MVCLAHLLQESRTIRVILGSFGTGGGFDRSDVKGVPPVAKDGVLLVQYEAEGEAEQWAEHAVSFAVCFVTGKLGEWEDSLL